MPVSALIAKRHHPSLSGARYLGRCEDKGRGPVGRYKQDRHDQSPNPVSFRSAKNPDTLERGTMNILDVELHDDGRGPFQGGFGISLSDPRERTTRDVPNAQGATTE